MTRRRAGSRWRRTRRRIHQSKSGDVNHTAQNKTDAPMVHVLFEILAADHKGPSIMPVKHH
jgi:hypothetical protein